MTKYVQIARGDSQTAAILCQLIRMVKEPSFQIKVSLLQTVVWQKIGNLASRQGVLAYILDAISLLPKENLPAKELLLQWIGETVAQENSYKNHAQAISELSAFYESHGIKMMLLKGWGLSLNYPHPNHRPTGDVDIWLYGDQERGDELLSKEKDIHPIKSSHHTIFFNKDVEVENHITFIEIDCHKPDGSEEVLLQYAKEPAIEVQGANGNTVLLPSPNLNAYFLLRHSSGHFATENITLRHLLDWGFFVEKYHGEIDWDALYANAKEKNMHVFLDCQNAICVNELGFPPDIFPIRERHPELEKRIFNDILYPEFQEIAPDMKKHFVKYCYVKTKRHLANKWKYDITYKEHFLSILSRFAWNRIKAPYSFSDMVNDRKNGND